MVASSSPLGSPEIHRILHIFRAPVGGLFRHVSDLVRLQVAAGHDVGIVCDSLTGGERAERLLNELLPHLSLGIARLPMRRGPGLSDLTTLAAVRRIAGETGATVLHGHGAKGGVFARLSGNAATDQPVIRAYTPHGGSYNYAVGTCLHRAYMAIEEMLERRTDVFLFESAFIAGLHRRYCGGPRRLTRLVHNGVAAAEFEPIVGAAERFDLVYIGELRDAKGIPYLLDALVQLRAAGRRLSLLMVGSGPDEESLKQRVATLGLHECVSFEPPQPIRAVLARGRVMVVPSLAESLPYVVLEAAAACQPLVSTDAGGIPEIFGACADQLVPRRDATALAAAIVRVVDEDPTAQIARVAAFSASVRERFSMDQMGTDVLAGYAAAFREKSRRPAAVPSTVSAQGAGKTARPLSVR